MWTTFHVQSQMLQINHVHKITENSSEVQTTVGISNQITLQGSQLKGIAQSKYWFRHQLYQSRNFPETLS